MMVTQNRKESDSFSVMTEQERGEFARRIAPRRAEKRLTQAELGEMSGVSARTVGNIEAGHTTPQADVLRRLAVALDLAPEPHLDSDVEGWLAMVGPLLQAMSRGQRARMMGEFLPKLVNAIKNDPGDDNARLMDKLG